MRAYLIAPAGAGPGSPSDADALILDGRAGPPPSWRAGGEAIQGRRADGSGAALDGFASLAMTAGQCPERLLVRIDGIEAPGLDFCLAGAAALRPDAIVLPARHGRDVAHLGSRLAVLEAEHGLPDGGIGIVALVACASGLFAAGSFAGASRRLRGLGWDAEMLGRELGMPMGSAGIASNPNPHPEAPASAGLEGGLQPAARSLEPSFEARLRLAPRIESGAGSQDEGGGGTGGGCGDPWEWSPPLAHARAVVRLAAAAAAAGVEAIEAAYLGEDAEGFGAHVAAARRDGFGAIFARNPSQARLIRAAQ